jgi:hypothetical protein
MALPLLLGFGLPALAGSGMLAGTAAAGLAAFGAPTLAGIGAGLGSFLETGDVGKGIQTGLIAGLGGKAMGALTGGGNAALSGAIGDTTSGATKAAIDAAMKEGGKNAFLKGVTSKGLQGSLAGATLPGVGTAALVGSVMNPPTVEMPEKKTYDIPPPMPRIRSYQPKTDMSSTAEETMISYGLPMAKPEAEGELPFTNYAKNYRPPAGIYNNMFMGFAEGGEVEAPEDMNEKDVIVEAVKAIKGLSDAPEVALGIFLSEYGEEALRDLVEKVQSGALDDTIERFANGDKGMVEGMGDGSGEDDMIPATMDGEQDVLLTEGEFVMRQPTTKAIQDEFGSEFLDIINQSEDKAPEKIREMVGVES